SEREWAGAALVEFDRFGKILTAAIEEPADVRGGGGDRTDARAEPYAMLGRGGRRVAEFVVLDGERDVSEAGLVGDIHRKEGHDGRPPVLAQGAKPPVRARGVTFGHGQQREQPGG